jgi:hypothetical protein
VLLAQQLWQPRIFQQRRQQLLQICHELGGHVWGLVLPQDGRVPQHQLEHVVPVHAHSPMQLLRQLRCTCGCVQGFAFEVYCTRGRLQCNGQTCCKGEGWGCQAGIPTLRTAAGAAVDATVAVGPGARRLLLQHLLHAGVIIGAVVCWEAQCCDYSLCDLLEVTVAAVGSSCNAPRLPWVLK